MLDPTWLASTRFDDRGLVTAVAQDALTGTVLMVAFMNRDALQRTLDTGEAHFWSRSRQQLWHKGETSGATLRVERIQPDCDGDALLLSVTAAGPACHLGRRSCFLQDSLFLDRFQSVLEQRKESDPAESYTAALYRAGVQAISRKVGEEAIEVILAGANHDQQALVGEVADLWYHTAVLLAKRGLRIDDVLRELNRRRAASGDQPES